MSLSPQTISIIKNSIPLLESNGETLTRLFYQRMFEHNPEVRPYFNPAHQHAGAQQRALAGAILAYAQHIENPAALSQAVSLIANKHVSLMVKPEHYPIVGENLLAALSELLGDTATPEFIGAWKEAYGYLASVLINAERDLYSKQQGESWTGFREFRVTRLETESEEIQSLYLEPVQALTNIKHQPGQYLTIRVPHPETRTTMRNYSISSAPGHPLRISIKKESGDVDGWASKYLHQRAVGDVLEIGPPCGDFVLGALDEARPLVFIAGGVGVTPLLSMLHAAVDARVDRTLVFIHAARNNMVRAFDAELRQLTSRHPYAHLHVCLEEFDAAMKQRQHGLWLGRVTPGLLCELIEPNSEVYYCGPAPFMADIASGLKEVGVPASQQHHEFFGPASTLS